MALCDVKERRLGALAEALDVLKLINPLPAQDGSPLHLIYSCGLDAIIFEKKYNSEFHAFPESFFFIFLLLIGCRAGFGRGESEYLRGELIEALLAFMRDRVVRSILGPFELSQARLGLI